MARREGNSGLTVDVRNNNVDQAISALKKKIQKDGLMKEIRRRKHYEKPSEKKRREKAENTARSRKRQSKLDW